jgi:hypothetical protein
MKLIHEFMQSGIWKKALKDNKGDFISVPFTVLNFYLNGRRLCK